MKMNKLTPILIVLFIFFSIPIGYIAAQPQTSQTPSKNFVIGVGLGTGNWDPAAYTPGVQEYYLTGCLETLIWWREPDNSVQPLLATNWTIYPRAPETGSWENYSGGIEAIAFSLRQGVKFHDGSDFNATVAKWNFDRRRVVSGNETGQSSVVSYAAWYKANTWKDFFAPNWNLTWGLGNPNIFGTDNMIPIINKTEIINPYLINVTLNPWAISLNSLETTNIGVWPIISMVSYEDYADKALPALVLNPPGYPGHFIGTGPYKFDYIDEQVTQMGHMIKFNDYWNRTALEAEGWFTIEEINVRHFADVNVRTTALLNGEVDWIGDQRQIPISDHQTIIDNPLTNLYGIRYDRAPTFVSLMCKEGLDTPTPLEAPWWGMTPRQIFPFIAPALGINVTETPITQGMNRTIRRALSYAFDYLNLETAMGGWGQVSQHIFGPQSQFYNLAIPAPYYNVTKAREILLNDPYYGPLCTSRGLTLSSTDAQWNAIAASNPLETHTMLYPGGGVGGFFDLFPVYMEPALASIGCGFESTTTDDIIGAVLLGKFLLYDMVPFMLDVAPTDPRLNLLWFTSSRRYIPHFSVNLPHMANSTIDNIIYEMQFKALNTLQDEMDIVANHIQNYDIPWLVIERYNISFAMNAGFDYHPDMPYWASNIQPNFALINGIRVLPPSEFIPGYSEPLVVVASVISIVGIIYVMMRKKKQTLS